MKNRFEKILKMAKSLKYLILCGRSEFELNFLVKLLVENNLKIVKYLKTKCQEFGGRHWINSVI